MIITIDYDGTASTEEVQEMVIWLMEEGVDIYILTSRYDDLHAHMYPENPFNEPLWEDIDRMEIPREKVFFTNMRPKAEFLRDTKVFAHIDDDMEQLSNITAYTNTIGIWVGNAEWKNSLKKIVGIEQKRTEEEIRKESKLLKV